MPFRTPCSLAEIRLQSGSLAGPNLVTVCDYFWWLA